MSKGLAPLWSALDFTLSEVLRADFFLGVAGAAGAIAVALTDPDALIRAVPVASGVVGVILGAVIAGVAVQTAFMDQAFLRKLRAIKYEPVMLVAPFLFTATIGVFAMLGLICMSTLSAKSHIALIATFGGITGFLTVWSVASLLYCLSTLIQFMGLKMDAVDVPDD
jgi:hypothetical protein